MTGFYRINARLSADNGAKNSLTTMVNLARIMDTKVLWGNHYGDDFIRRPAQDENCRLIEDLMASEGLVYEIVDRIPGFHPFSYENAETSTPAD
jgi:hypothetical protein